MDGEAHNKLMALKEEVGDDYVAVVFNKDLPDYTGKIKDIGIEHLYISRGGDRDRKIHFSEISEIEYAEKISKSLKLEN